MTGMSPQYSQSNWRQGPHGGVGLAVSAATAIMTKSRWPSESAFSSATRSAQTVSPYEAFSTLQPVYVVPSAESNAAPTLNREYGAAANALAERAAATRLRLCLAVASAAARLRLFARVFLDAPKHALQQADEFRPYSRGGLDDLLGRDWLREDASSHVRDARHTKHFNAHVARDDGFRNR